jgi:hypothetical protein
MTAEALATVVGGAVVTGTAVVVVAGAAVVVEVSDARVVDVAFAAVVDEAMTAPFEESEDSDFGLSAPTMAKSRANPIAIPVTVHLVFFVQSGFIQTRATPIGQQHRSPTITAAM